jgi:hypothetical protein
MAGEVMERIALISRSRDEKVCWWRGAFYKRINYDAPSAPDDNNRRENSQSDNTPPANSRAKGSQFSVGMTMADTPGS